MGGSICFPMTGDSTPRRRLPPRLLQILLPPPRINLRINLPHIRIPFLRMILPLIPHLPPPGLFHLAFLLMNLPKHRPTPPTPRPRRKTFRNLRRNNRLLNPAKTPHLAQAHMKTKADFVVVLQRHSHPIVSPKIPISPQSPNFARSAPESGCAIILFVVDPVIAVLKGAHEQHSPHHPDRHPHPPGHRNAPRTGHGQLRLLPQRRPGLGPLDRAYPAINGQTVTPKSPCSGQSNSPAAPDNLASASGAENGKCETSRLGFFIAAVPSKYNSSLTLAPSGLISLPSTFQRRFDVFSMCPGHPRTASPR